MQTTEQLNTALAGRYAIDRLVGEGGMATVYLARDVRHNRKVALKVLKPDLGAVVGVDRFLAEIQVTANLQHPNLLPLFDSGAADGLLFYVMPYIEGESLRARLDREKQLPIDDAVRIAVAVASALDYAHRQGVIHRDLKPENILMHEGQPLVADFGIALAVSNAGGNRITQTGLSLGTPQYMSPEQATGDRTIDARTDLYSLGALTYEMLTGEPPHTGSTSQAVIARVLTERPRSIRASRPSVSVQVEGAVERALEKLPADRWATAKEFSEAITGARPVTATASGSVGGSAGTPVSAPRRRLRVRDVASWALAAAGIAGTAYFATRREPAAVPARLLAELPESVTFSALAGTRIALSRDGRRLVVAGTKGGRTALFIRGLDDPALQLVRGSEDDARSPGFSPDGQWLLFLTPGRQIKKVPITGGTPQLIADSAFAPQWGDGDQVVYEREGGIWVASSDGATHRRVLARDQKANANYVAPEILPGGRDVLFTAISSASSNLADGPVALVSLSDGRVTDLGIKGIGATFAGEWLLVTRSGGLVFAAPFSLRKRAITGPAALVLQGVSVSFERADLAVAQNGTLAYKAGTSRLARGMFAVDRQGVEQQLTREPNEFNEPRLSPDGRHVAVRIGAFLGSGDLWVHDIGAGTLTRLTTNGTSVRGEWSRDGKRIVYADRITADSILLMSKPWDGNGTATVLLRGSGLNDAHSLETVSLGPSRGWSAMRIGGSANNADIWLAPTDSLAAMKPFVATAANEYAPRISPNGRLVVYSSNESGRNEIYVTPVPGPGPRVQVSIDGGQEPMWSPDGTQVFFRGVTRMMVATVAERPALAVTRRDSLFVDRYDRYVRNPTYDVFPDGKRFVMTRSLDTRGGDNAKLFVVVNWPQLVGKQGAAVEPR